MVSHYSTLLPEVSNTLYLLPVNYRALFIDMDDTLLDSTGSVSPENISAIHRLDAAGVELVLCSGRPSESLMATATAIFGPKEPTWIIGFNGSQILSLPGPHYLRNLVLDPAICRTVLAQARKHGLLLQAYRNGTVWAESESPRLQAYTRKLKLPETVVPDLAPVLEAGTPKVLVNAPHETLVEFQKELAESGDIPEGVMVFSKPEYLEFIPPGSSKGSALSELCEHLGIPVEQTIAAGDSQNDIEMLEIAGTSVAPANARAEARAKARVQLERNNDQSILVEIVERFFPNLPAS